MVYTRQRSFLSKSMPSLRWGGPRLDPTLEEEGEDGDGDGDGGGDGDGDDGASPAKDSKSQVVVYNGVEVHSNRGLDMERAGWLSKVFLGWVTALVHVGYRKPQLETSDLWKLRSSDDPEMLSDRLLGLLEEYRDPATGKFSDYALWRACARMFRRDLVVSGALELLFNGLRFAGPVLLRLIVLAIEDGTANSVRGYMLGLGLLLTQCAQTLCQSHSRLLSVNVGLRLKNALSQAVFRHVLKVDQEGKHQLSNGNVTNLLATDSQVALEFMRLWNRFWTAPLVLLAGVVYIYTFVGPSVFFGVILMAAFVPASISIGKVQTRLQRAKMAQTDARVKMVNEMMLGIKVLKLNGWEKPLLAILDGVRSVEMAALRRLAYYQALTLPIAIAIPNVASVITFAAYILLGNDITPAETFAVVSAFVIIRSPFVTLPLSITMVTRALVSVRRFTDFFELRTKGQHVQRTLSLPDETKAKANAKANDNGGDEDNGDGNATSLVQLPAPADVDLGTAKEDKSNADHDEDNDERDGNATSLAQLPADATADVDLRLKADQNVIANFDVEGTVQEGTVQEGTVQEEGTEGTEGTEAEDTDVAIEARDACFTWTLNLSEGEDTEKEPFKLEHLDFSIRRGELVAVIGRIAQGKSSLINCLCEEMRPTSGSVRVRGSVALCPQEAFIMNRTVRENILFEAPLDEERYAATLECCALVADLKTLPAADLTEIGERGINISGGQKARIGLARAVFAQPDVVLLDDPLSAVDAHVGKHIFNRCISNNPGSALRGTTRIFATNQLQLLDQCDRILLMDGGRIVEQGTYAEIASREGSLIRALQQKHALEADVDHDDDDEDHQGRDQDRGQDLDLEKMLDMGLGDKDDTGDKDDKDGKEEGKEEAKGDHDDKDDKEEGKDDKEEGKEDEDREQDGASTSSASTGTGVGAADDGSADSEKLLAKGRLVQQEGRAQGRIGFGVVAAYWLAGSMGRAGVALLVLATFFVTEAVFLSIDAWLALYAQQGDGVNDEGDISEATFLGVYVGLTVAFFAILLGRAVTYAAFTIRAADVLYSGLQSNVFRLPMSFFWQTPLGRVLNRLSKDTNDIDQMLPQQMQWLIMTLVRVLGVLAIISISVPYFMLAIVPFSVVYVAVRQYYRNTAVAVQRIESVLRSPVYSHMAETVEGAATIKAFGKQARWLAVASTLVGRNHRALLAVEVVQIWLAMRLEFLGASIVFAAAVAVIAGDAEPGLAGLALAYALNVTINVNMSVQMSTQVEAKMNAVERVLEYTALPPEVDAGHGSDHDPGHPGHLGHLEGGAESSVAVAGASASTPTVAVWPSAGGIRFEAATLTYRAGLEPALRGVTLDIPGGTTVGLVGKTGSGKSTLNVALFRLAPLSGGRILIDGVDIATVGLERLRQSITAIPQDPVLFTSSLRKNLDPFEQYSEAELWAAVDRAHLRGTVEALPSGLESHIAEGGENLSVGERQLVCIARALLRRSRIVVLDEATASIDRETDALIQTTIRTQFAQCTLLVIAHRLETILDLDSCIVMHDGRVAEFDKIPVLLQKPDGMLASLVKASKSA